MKDEEFLHIAGNLISSLSQLQRYELNQLLALYNNEIVAGSEFNSKLAIRYKEAVDELKKEKIKSTYLALKLSQLKNNEITFH